VQDKASAWRILSEAEWRTQPTNLVSVTDLRLAKAKVAGSNSVFPSNYDGN
jgi:hypothetical protein